MNRQQRLILSVIIAALPAVLTASLQADVRLPAIFGEHMILQEEMPLPVWGDAAAGEKVSVSFAGQTVSTEAGADGKWAVKLAPLKANATADVFVVHGNNSVTLADVLVGEVWFSSGQSNMAMQVKAALNADEEISAAKYPQIRWFMIDAVNAENPLTDTKGEWQICSPATAGEFSAAAYFFARDLHQALKQPVGMVHGAWGGSMVEWWTSQQTLAATPEAKPILDFWAKVTADWPARKPKYDKMMADYKEALEAAKKSGKPAPKKPREEAYRPGSLFQPGNLYNGMVRPVAPYGIRGVVWYQGESNSDRPVQYRALFPAMIRDWRKTWGEGNFPFLFVQLPNFKERIAEPGESNWAALRESQLKSLAAAPNTAMAISIDIGEAGNIHPKNKQEIGRRLSLTALATVYKQPVEWSGPLFQHSEIEGASVRLHFTHADGLKAGEGPVKGFAIAGEDRHYVWADARIDGQTVVVSSPAVPKPAAVRYAWADNPDCNLQNAAGLPASPFRTDDWPTRPAFKEMKLNRWVGNKQQLRLWFKDVGEGGFVDEPADGFMVAGEDKVFHPAKTQFLADTLLVWSDKAPKPVAVRYLWAGSPTAGSTHGLRAVTGMALLPFRTDEWSDATYAGDR
jgi:sialate O-acetylesterase